VGLLSSCVHKVSKKKRNLVNNRLYQRQTVRCQFNDNHAYSVSDLPAPAAQTSADGTACSCLPWPAVLPGRPHSPTMLASLAWLSLYSPTPPVILRRRQPHTAAEPVNPRTHSTWETTFESSSAPGRSLTWPRRCPPPWCSRHGIVNTVNERQPSEEDCTWRG
jgi:hypothetical protein